MTHAECVCILHRKASNIWQTLHKTAATHRHAHIHTHAGQSEEMQIGGWLRTYMDAHTHTAAAVNMLHWWMRWDKSWEDGGRGVCPDSCQHLTHTAQKPNGHSHTPHACHLLFSQSLHMQVHLNPIWATVSEVALHILYTISINSTAPSLPCFSLLSILLSHAASLFFLPAVSYSMQEHEQRQSPVDVSTTTDCTNMRSQSGICMKQTRRVKLI